MMQLSYRQLAKRRVLTSASAIALAASVSSAAFAQQAQLGEQLAQAAPAAPAVIDEIIVTGSRVIRDGYEAPTPVSVLGVAELNEMATANIADAVNRLPALANSLSTRGSSSTADMTGGINNLNLRGINPTRTLVLIDGKRVVGSTLAGFNNNGGAVDVNTVPTGLVSRVDIVTGGASAAYGSDALAGVVNFVFDKTYTGIKGDIQGGITTYGDNENYKIELTAGFPFAGGRGHILMYGENGFEAGARREDRPWSETAYQIVGNPAYAAGNGQPQYIAQFGVGLATGTFGGLVTECTGYLPTPASCPLRGTQFLEGGTPAPFNFGVIAGNYMTGGDWESSRIDRISSVVTRLMRANTYLRARYDLTDDINVFAEWGWAYTLNRSADSVPQFQIGGGASRIKADNAFIPSSLRPIIAANGITEFRVGSTLDGMAGFGNKNERVQRRYVAGIDGSTDIGETTWTWDAYYQLSTTHASVRTPDDIIQGNLALAVDAVVDPSTGKIVCRSTLTNPGNGCVPYNIMGRGVNSKEAKDYVTGTGYALIYLQQDVMAASASGEPFDNWAGPVSLAFGIENRVEKVGGIASDLDINRRFFAGNFTASSGKYSVTEGFIETVFPLASGTSFAETLDLNGAVRFTDYSTSGFVTTWKIGATWSPVSDLTIRATRSRDIRAPNLGDLFLAGRSGTGAIIDRFNNDRISTIVTRVAGNPNLLPEKANTTGIGVVLQPSFLPGFGASIDYFNIDISGAIVTLNAQVYMDRCFAGETALCSFIERDANNIVTFVQVLPANVLSQSARGMDFEASYNFQLSDINEDWGGSIRLRALATKYMKLETVDGPFILDGAGVLSSGAAGLAATNGLFAPDIKYMMSATYTGESFSGTLSARGWNSGVYNNALVSCTSGCPVSKANAPTVGFENKIPGVMYFDLSLNQKIMDGAMEMFFVVENLFDKDPPLIAGNANNGYYQGQAVYYYDTVGRSFRLGTRFKF